MLGSSLIIQMKDKAYISASTFGKKVIRQESSAEKENDVVVHKLENVEINAPKSSAVCC